MALIGRRRLTREDRLMLAFAIPPLALVAAWSVLRRADANWAAPAGIAMTILAVSWWLRNKQTSMLIATLAIGVVAQGLLLVADAYAYRVSIPLLERNADVYSRTLGWRALGEQTAKLAASIHARTIAAEDRPPVAELIYYLRNAPLDVKSWQIGTTPGHQFDLTRPFRDDAREPVLFITECPLIERVQRFYADVRLLSSFTVSTGPHSERAFTAFALTGRTHPIAPLGACAKSPS